MMRKTKKKKKIDEEDLLVHRKSILKAGKREEERYRGQTRAIDQVQKGTVWALHNFNYQV